MFLNEKVFQEQIESMVVSNKSNYVDAVLQYCKENDVDAEDIKKLVSSNLKDKIRMSAMESGLMKKTAMLPL